MWKKKEYPETKDLVEFIGQKVKEALSFQSYTINFFSIKEIVSMVFMDKKNTPVYLNLFVKESDSKYAVYILNKIVSADTLFKIPSRYKDDVFTNTILLQYNSDIYLSLNSSEITNIADLSSHCKTSCDLIIDESIVEEETIVKDIIKQYLDMQAFIKSEEFAKLEKQEADYIQSFDLKRGLIDRFAQACQKAMKFHGNSININEFPTEYKIQIILEGNNLKKVLYCIFEKESLNAYYMKNTNGVWLKELMPLTIGEVTRCFI